MPQGLRRQGVRLLHLEPALQQRTLALSALPLRWLTHLFLLRSGRAVLSFTASMRRRLR